jgi:hypothetical protein
MQAAVITDLSGPDAIEVRELAEPTLSENQVLVDVEYAGVVFPDVLFTRGEYQLRPKVPFTPGWESVRGGARGRRRLPGGHSGCCDADHRRLGRDRRGGRTTSARPRSPAARSPVHWEGDRATWKSHVVSGYTDWRLDR